MEWYEIVAMFFALVALLSLCGCLFYICHLDYKHKENKLTFEKKKYDDLECDLMHIYSVLDEINNKIKE